MKIAIDTSPLENSGHKVRGVGFYLENLKRSLVTYFPENEYTFFTRFDQIPVQVDLIHYPYFDPFFSTLPRSDIRKRIVTVHDLTPLIFPAHFPAGIRGKLRWYQQRKSLRNTAGIITDSFSSKKDIEHVTRISGDKIDVAYLAASDEFKRLEKGFWKRDMREKYNLPEKFILYVGDATWNKNVLRLVQSVKDINIPLVMVGKALTEQNIDTTNNWNNELIAVQDFVKDLDQFQLLGFVPTEEVVKLYNMASVFVFPSLYEGFGLPILEAMQCGCPVVTTRSGSLQEVAGDSAVFVDGYDLTSIANGISEVYYNPHLQTELITKGYMQSKKFSWKKTAFDTMEAYKKAIL